MARVVFVTTSYPRTPGDPSGHFVETEARRRALDGDSVTVLAPGNATAFAPVATAHTARAAASPHVVWLPGGDAFGPPGALERLRERPARVASATRFMVEARRRLASLEADQIVAHWMVPSAWPIASPGRGALEVVLHGTDVRLVERLPRRLRGALVRTLLARGARFRFVSHELCDRLVHATTPELLARSRVEPCALDVRSAPPRDVARARLGLDDGERVAVIVGRLVSSKRPAEGIRMAREARARRIVVIGGGPLAEELRRSNPDATFTGALPREGALTWIAAADLLVSASRREGAPTAIREARVLGTPVLAVPSGDLERWASDDTGITLVWS